MKKILKWIGILVLLLIAAIAIWMYSQHESLPETTPSSEADQLAQSVLTAINKPAWDTLQGLEWEFPGGHQYVWDKVNNKARISWGEFTVRMNLDDQSGTAEKNGTSLTGEDLNEALQKAWSYWCNDSFWMFAPFKLFDPNTERSIVNHEGEKALMVTYKGGGVTPGDSYLWLLDDNNIPKAYKMWVNIIPVGGLEVSWDGWTTLPYGAKVATIHKSDLFSMEMKGVKGHTVIPSI